MPHLLWNPKIHYCVHNCPDVSSLPTHAYTSINLLEGNLVSAKEALHITSPLLTITSIAASFHSIQYGDTEWIRFFTKDRNTPRAVRIFCQLKATYSPEIKAGRNWNAHQFTPCSGNSSTTDRCPWYGILPGLVDSNGMNRNSPVPNYNISLWLSTFVC